MMSGQNVPELPATDGPIFLPGDPALEEELSGYSIVVRHTPDIVFGVASVSDIQTAIAYARAAGLRVAVHATGHSYRQIDGGVIISTKRLDSVQINVDEQTATIGAGVRWGAVIGPAAEAGLAPISGSSPLVGAAGYLLGGGFGPLVRSHGVSSDYLLAATIVTGTGEVIEVDAEHHPDLFWALQGGKSGFGVVASLTVRLVAIPSLYAGSLLFAEEHIETALRGWAAWTGTADPQVTTSAAIIQFPPVPFVPEVLQGKRMLALRFACAGSIAEGERLAGPLRALAPVEIDAIGPMSLDQTFRIHSDPPEPLPIWMRATMLKRIDNDLITHVLESVGAETDNPFVICELRHIGSEAVRNPARESAVGGREAAFTFMLISADPTLFGSDVPLIAADLINRVAVWEADEGNVNFSGALPDSESYRKLWSDPTRTRRNGVAATYDPHELFGGRN
jgi:hypothetical protein